MLNIHDDPNLPNTFILLVIGKYLFSNRYIPNGFTLNIT